MDRREVVRIGRDGMTASPIPIPRATMRKAYAAMAPALLLAGFLYVSIIVIDVVLASFLPERSLGSPMPLAACWLASVVVGVTLYRTLGRLFRHAYAVPLRAKSAAAHVCDGAKIGALVVLAAALLLWATGLVEIHRGVPRATDLMIFSVLVAPLVEEVIFRGVVMRFVALAHGSKVGLIVSSLAFGLVHLGNSHADLWAVLNIAFGSGMLFGLLYLRSGEIFVPIGAHIGWNAMEGIVLGSRNSGADVSGLLSTVASGPAALSGGAFGLEASIVTTLLCSIASFALMHRVRRARFDRNWARQPMVGAALRVRS